MFEADKKAVFLKLEKGFENHADGLNATMVAVSNHDGNFGVTIYKSNENASADEYFSTIMTDEIISFSNQENYLIIDSISDIPAIKTCFPGFFEKLETVSILTAHSFEIPEQQKDENSTLLGEDMYVASHICNAVNTMKHQMQPPPF